MLRPSIQTRLIDVPQAQKGHFLTAASCHFRTALPLLGATGVGPLHRVRAAHGSMR
jgi:hypothetical protein